MKKHFMLISVLFLAVVVSACSFDRSSNQIIVQESAWSLITINQEDLLESTQITLEFTENQISGRAGCNHYSASYEAVGDSIAFGPIVRTEMACMEPVGVMEQERNYLEILRAAKSIGLTGEILTVISEAGQTLNYQPLSDGLSNQDVPVDDQTVVSQTTLTAVPEPVSPAETFETPVGFREYRDSETGITIYIPEDWYIQNQSIVEGKYAIFSSYSPDKYIGGGVRQPDDIKCDLNLDLDVDSIGALVEQWDASSITSIISEREIVLDSGSFGTIFVIDSLGYSTTLVSELDNRLVLFTCWGDFEYFEQIAVTLHLTIEISI